MDHPNRINPTALTPTTARQTPQNDFGQVLARTLSGAAQLGGSVAGAFIPGAPLLSAALSTVSGVAGISGTSSSSSAMTMVGSAPSTAGGGKGEQWDLLEAQRLLNSEQQSFNASYLSLQNAMQKESREFTALSNIMKVRHDSAKAAINNIR